MIYYNDKVGQNAIMKHKRSDMRLTEEEKNTYLNYIREYLLQTGGDRPEDPNQGFRSRIAHTKRVLEWSEILREGYDLEEHVTELAILFHDAGYLQTEKREHGIRSAAFFEEFGRRFHLDSTLIKRVADMILLHVDKKALNNHLPIETILFLESDLMDEEGAMLIAWDCMVAGKRGATDFLDAYYQLEKFYQPLDNPMVTPKAIQIWDEKQKLRKEFMMQLKRDLFVNKNRP